VVVTFLSLPKINVLHAVVFYVVEVAPKIVKLEIPLPVHPVAVYFAELLSVLYKCNVPYELFAVPALILFPNSNTVWPILSV